MTSGSRYFGEASNSSSSRSLSREERIRIMYNDIQKERRRKDLIIIAVVSGQKDKEEMTKKLALRFWQFNRGKSLVLVKTKQELRNEVIRPTKGTKATSLTLMVFGSISEISLRVQSPNIETFKVHHCGHHGLVIDGASELNNMRLDEWRNLRHSGTKLRLGPGVSIRENEKPVGSSQAEDDISSAEQQRESTVPSEPENANMNGNTWDNWKGVVAGVFGAFAGGIALTTNFIAKCKGVFFSFKYGPCAIQFGAGTAKAALSTSACLGAAFIAVVVFCVVYFVPWEYFLSSSKPTVTSWSSSFWKWWNKTPEATSKHGNILSWLFM
ncbi:hypothetical protein FoTM2_013364 [Fusarium oxysporum f. sp. vasinfectum]|nr:hypothetical protein FoTM2_013364 [Fusarium oxysporum f. sp. vasinfectum]